MIKSSFDKEGNLVVTQKNKVSKDELIDYLKSLQKQRSSIMKQINNLQAKHAFLRDTINKVKEHID